MAAGWNARGRPWRGAPDPEETRLATQLVATLTTSLGDIEVELFPDHAPKTVANFVELAEGTREWTDPQSAAEPAVRRDDLPPGDSGFHDPGRGPTRYRHRRPGLPVQRRDPPRPGVHPPVPAGYGECRPGHQRVAVLHHRR